MSDDLHQLLTLAEAAERLQVSVKTIRRYIATNRLDAYRVGPTLLRVYASSVDELLKQVPTAHPATTEPRCAFPRRHADLRWLLEADHIWPANMIVLTPEEHRSLDRP